MYLGTIEGCILLFLGCQTALTLLRARLLKGCSTGRTDVSVNSLVAGLLHKLPNWYPVWFLQEVSIFESHQHHFGHPLQEEVQQLAALVSMLFSLDVDPWGSIYLLCMILVQGCLVFSMINWSKAGTSV